MSWMKFGLVFYQPSITQAEYPRHTIHTWTRSRPYNNDTCRYENVYNSTAATFLHPTPWEGNCAWHRPSKLGQHPNVPGTHQGCTQYKGGGVVISQGDNISGNTSFYFRTSRSKCPQHWHGANLNGMVTMSQIKLSDGESEMHNRTGNT